MPLSIQADSLPFLVFLLALFSIPPSSLVLPTQASSRPPHRQDPPLVSELGRNDRVPRPAARVPATRAPNFPPGASRVPCLSPHPFRVLPGGYVPLGSSQGGRQGHTSPHAPAAGRRRLQAQEGRVAWRPRPGKFLLAHCLSGRISNQMFCMRSALKAAHALNRSLLVPTKGVAHHWSDLAYEFPWTLPVDWARMRACLGTDHGPHPVLTISEFLTLYNRTHINVTFFASLDRNNLFSWGREAWVRAYERLNARDFTLPPRDSTPDEPLVAKQPPLLEEVKRVGESLGKEEVICLGEMISLHLVPEPVLPPAAVPDCSNLWRPHRAIREFVDGFAASVVGDNFSAIHLRRGDFYMHLANGHDRDVQRSAEWGYPSAAEAAEGVRRRLQEYNSSVLFVATNARKLEFDIFKEVVQAPLPGFAVTKVVILESFLEEEEKRRWLEQQAWARKLVALHRRLAEFEAINGLVWSLVDKFICVKAAHFFPSKDSSFSLEITYNLRYDEGFPVDG